MTVLDELSKEAITANEPKISKSKRKQIEDKLNP